MAHKLIKRSPWLAILLLFYAVQQAFYIYLSQEVFRTTFRALLLLFILVLIARLLVVPIVKIQGSILYIYENIFSKPIQLNIHEIQNIQVFLSSSFPVSFLFDTIGKKKVNKTKDWVFGSKSIQLYNFLKSNLENCTFKESKYIEPENKYFVARLLNKTFTDRVLISFSSLFLIFILAAMYIFFNYV